MLVRFVSSETGEIIMFAETARSLLQAIGRSCTAEGSFTRDQMLPAAQALRRAVQDAENTSASETDEPEATNKNEPAEAAESPVVQKVGFAQRAWPLIDMLERTTQGGKKANIIWQASADFEAPSAVCESP